MVLQKNLEIISFLNIGICVFLIQEKVASFMFVEVKNNEIDISITVDMISESNVAFIEGKHKKNLV